MPLIRTHALILHSFPYGESSKILRLLTSGYGARSVIAKGARSPKSRFGGVLEPFTEAEVQFHLREGRDLFTLSSFALIRGRQAIGRDLGAFTGASLVAEIILRFATDEPQPDLYRSVTAVLDALAEGEDDPVVISLSALWMIVSLFGFQPEMEACLRCGRELGEQEPSAFDVQAGGVVCRLCDPAGRVVPAGVRRDITDMSAGQLPRLHDQVLHGKLLHAFLSAHLMHGRPLRSLPLFLEHLGRR